MDAVILFFTLYTMMLVCVMFALTTQFWIGLVQCVWHRVDAWMKARSTRWWITYWVLCVVLGIILGLTR